MALLGEACAGLPATIAYAERSLQKGSSAESIPLPTTTAQRLVVAAKACNDFTRAPHAWRAGLRRYKRLVQGSLDSDTALSKRAAQLVAALPSHDVPCMARLRQLASALEEAVQSALDQQQQQQQKRGAK